MKEQIAKMSINELQDELKKMQPDFFTTTTMAEHAWQPIENINRDPVFRKKKNEFSIFVEASFQGGVFNMPLVDPSRRPGTEELFEMQNNNN